MKLPGNRSRRARSLRTDRLTRTSASQAAAIHEAAAEVPRHQLRASLEFVAAELLRSVEQLRAAEQELRLKDSEIVSTRGAVAETVALRTAELRAANSFTEDLLERERAGRADAERACRVKSDFMSLMSREFRAGLQAAVTELEELRTELDGSMSAPARESLETAILSHRELLELVEEMLEFGSLESRIAPALPERPCS